MPCRPDSRRKKSNCPQLVSVAEVSTAPRTLLHRWPRSVLPGRMGLACALTTMKSPSVSSVNHLALGTKLVRFTLGRLLQQQLGRGVHGFEPGRERADLRIELRQTPRLVGLVAHLGAQRLGDGAQAFQKARRVVRELAQRLVQCLGQHAARHAHARRAPGAVLGLERLAVQVHHQARQVLQVLAQLAGVARDVGHLAHLHQRADAQRAAGEPVDPGEAAQVRAAGELVERGGGQVVRLVQHQQAVVQLGQHARAQDDSSRSWLATITCAPTRALRWS
jgi:hypothetical protein